MSQKTAKRIRRLEAQMLSTNAIMRTQMVRLDHLTDWVASAERTRAAQVEEAAARISRRSEARAEKRVRRWQWIAVSAVSSAVLVELIAAAIVHTEAAPPPVQTPERPVPGHHPDRRPSAGACPRGGPGACRGDQDCTITFYCNEQYPHICGTGDGIAADGTPALAWGTCAVDPDVIPLGSTVEVDLGDGYGPRTLRANDTGVSGDHLDICVGSHQEALERGVTKAAVYVYEEGANDE